MAEEKSEQVQDTSDVESVAESATEEATVTEEEQVVKDDENSNDELDKRIQRANKAAAKFRVEKNEVETKYNNLIDNLGKALGFVEETTNDADALADKVEKLQSENKNLKLMQAFNNVVKTEGADEELTWSYLMAKGGLTDLDVDDPELNAKLSEMISAAVENKPVLKSDASPAVAKKSGIDMSNDSQPLDTESRIRQLEADKNLKEARKLKSQRLYELAKDNN